MRCIIAQIETVTGRVYQIADASAAAFRVIADHLRCLAFAIADGSHPSNIDRGYVLRKVLRRAVRYGRTLGMERPFLADILPQLVASMGDDYSELRKSQNRIAEILTREEEAFIRTLRRGGNLLNQIIEKANKVGVMNGEDAFKLKDTYGLPIEEIRLIAKDISLPIDEIRYQELEIEARERSRNIQKNISQEVVVSSFLDFILKNGETKFVGYHQKSIESSVVGLMVNGNLVDQMKEGETGTVLLSETPFFAEMGGQIGDTGTLEGNYQHFIVQNCISPYKGLIAHQGILKKGELQIGTLITASIDSIRRQRIENNHTATHLLHWALHGVLGEHIKQAGSVVDSQRLRFDFSHHKQLSLEQLQLIEDLINEKIRENLPVKAYELSYEDAQRKEEIKQFFGEKYGSVVRVIDIDYSKELCGGTHTSHVGNIGLFRIVKENSIAAGVRRIEAVTGHEAENWYRQQEKILLELSHNLKTPITQLTERIEKLLEERKNLVEEIKTVRKNQLDSLAQQLLERASQIGNLHYIIAEISILVEELPLFSDLLFNRLKNGIIVLAVALPNKCQLLAKVSSDWITQGFSANELIKLAMNVVDGSGGGKAQTAQGGGKNWQKLPQAFELIKIFLKEKIKNDAEKNLLTKSHKIE
jgi:alanyl-tRNA synthetase